MGFNRNIFSVSQKKIIMSKDLKIFKKKISTKQPSKYKPGFKGEIFDGLANHEKHS